ncbi:MAG: amidohydrolase family protein [Bacteroidia bacterium]|jgi:cytosine/adenosine deaminase-related metal-dependent hydrolase|nr:amidohydrolase family protein [Bacteroidia bacterium]
MRFLQAEAIFDGHNFLEKGSIVVLNDRGETQDILPSNTIESSRVQKFNGLLCPGFVNAHCHLELSHMIAQVPRGTGLPAFGKQIISKRGSFKPEEVAERMQEADRYMWSKGIVAVGDISNNPASFITKAESKITYHTFIELLSLQPAQAAEVFKQGESLVAKAGEYGLKASLSPHAPYSVSRELFFLIKDWCEINRLPYTLHNQESEEELRFLKGEPGGFDELYRFLNVNLSFYKAPGKWGLDYLREFIPPSLSLLVHNTFSNAQDLALAAELNAYLCLCPGANEYIEERLPDFELFKPHIKKLCLGTDSLASNDQLNVLKEANTVMQKGKFQVEEILKMLSSQGAEALGLSQTHGQIALGKNAGLNLLEYKANQLSFLKKIV